MRDRYQAHYSPPSALLHLWLDGGSCMGPCSVSSCGPAPWTRRPFGSPTLQNKFKAEKRRMEDLRTASFPDKHSSAIRHHRECRRVGGGVHFLGNHCFDEFTLSLNHLGKHSLTNSLARPLARSRAH